jgi:hypothetical protein
VLADGCSRVGRGRESGGCRATATISGNGVHMLV